jgi:hypothetical protein
LGCAFTLAGPCCLGFTPTLAGISLAAAGGAATLFSLAVFTLLAGAGESTLLLSLGVCRGSFHGLLEAFKRFIEDFFFTEIRQCVTFAACGTTGAFCAALTFVEDHFTFAARLGSLTRLAAARGAVHDAAVAGIALAGFAGL